MFSVIIPNLNSPIIGRVLAALEVQGAAIAEVIVVGRDDAGRLPPDVVFIETPRPVPAARARNLGAARASGDMLLFVDADCLAAPDLLVRHAAAHTVAGRVVGGGVCFDAGDYWALCDNLLSFTPFLATAAAGERRYLPSLNLSLRRDLFWETGGFDERYPGAAGEDVDFSLRLRKRGAQLWFEPAATVLHLPQRRRPAAVWAHLRAFGRVHVRLQRATGGRAAPRLNPTWRPLAPLILALAPLPALADVLALYWRNPALRRYVRALPGLVWGKTAWYWGVAEGLLALPGAVVEE
jgi:hypothetical protein